MLLLTLCVYAGSLSYVFGSSVSSVDMEDARRGQIYVDQGSNILAVKSVHGDVAEFDKLVSRSDYVAGSSLQRRGAVHSISAIGGLTHALVGYSVTTPLYPLYPLAMAGIGYSSSSVDALVLGGFGVAFPLARLWETSNTFIQNGKINGYCAGGVSISGSVTFAASYGFSYRHNLSAFHWEIGANWIYRYGTGTSISPYAGIGVDI